MCAHLEGGGYILFLNCLCCHSAHRMGHFAHISVGGWLIIFPFFFFGCILYCAEEWIRAHLRGSVTCDFFSFLYFGCASSCAEDGSRFVHIWVMSHIWDMSHIWVRSHMSHVFSFIYFWCALYCADVQRMGLDLFTFRGGEWHAISFYCFFLGLYYIVQRMGRFVHI